MSMIFCNGKYLMEELRINPDKSKLAPEKQSRNRLLAKKITQIFKTAVSQVILECFTITVLPALVSFKIAEDKYIKAFSLFLFVRVNKPLEYQLQ